MRKTWSAIAGFEDGGEGPGAKEGRYSAVKSKKKDSPLKLKKKKKKKKCRSADILILTSKTYVRLLTSRKVR